MTIQFGCHLREGQLLLVHQCGIPNGMKVEVAPEPLHFHFVAAPVAAFADVERLVKVADQVDDEAKCGLLLGKGGPRIAKDIAIMVQRLKRIAFRRRMIVDDPVQRHIMPGRGRLLPKWRRVRTHLVRPVGGFIEAFPSSEDFLDVCSRESPELRFRDGRYDPMACLAQAKTGLGTAVTSAAARTNPAFIRSDFRDFGRLDAWPVKATEHKGVTAAFYWLCEQWLVSARRAPPVKYSFIPNAISNALDEREQRST